MYTTVSHLQRDCDEPDKMQLSLVAGVSIGVVVFLCWQKTTNGLAGLSVGVGRPVILWVGKSKIAFGGD